MFQAQRMRTAMSTTLWNCYAKASRMSSWKENGRMAALSAAYFGNSNLVHVEKGSSAYEPAGKQGVLTTRFEPVSFLAPQSCASPKSFAASMYRRSSKPMSCIGVLGMSLFRSQQTYLQPHATFCTTALFQSKRYVQFEQTSETLRGINRASSQVTTASRAEKHKKDASKWITKSTKDYVAEGDRDSATRAALRDDPTRERLRRNSVTRRQRATAIHEETDRIFESEIDRMRTDNSKRWKKGINFFKRHGWSFTILYLAVYLACLAALYVGFATEVINKSAVYDFLCIVFSNSLDKDKFYARVEAWDTYINFGFAFVVNEMLEIFRMPMMIFTFYTFRPYLVKLVKRTGNRKSTFRMNASES